MLDQSTNRITNHNKGVWSSVGEKAKNRGTIFAMAFGTVTGNSTGNRRRTQGACVGIRNSENLP